VQLHSFLISVLDSDQWSASCFVSFNSGEVAPVLIKEEAGWAPGPARTIDRGFTSVAPARNRATIYYAGGSKSLSDLLTATVTRPILRHIQPSLRWAGEVKHPGRQLTIPLHLLARSRMGRNISQYISTCLNISQYVSIYLNIP
jgi:hypothetical protein